jgi:multidrug transporter EmrE-like cation transporter
MYTTALYLYLFYIYKYKMSLPEIVALSCVEIVGDFGFKQFANNGGILPFSVGVLGYIGVIGMLIVSLQNSSVMMVNGAWDGISGLLESVAAYIFLGERFHNPLQYLGLILIAVGLYFLRIPLSKKKTFVWPNLFATKVAPLSDAKIG